MIRRLFSVWRKSATKQARVDRLLARVQRLHDECLLLGNETRMLVLAHDMTAAHFDRANALIAQQERLLRRSSRISRAVDRCLSG